MVEAPWFPGMLLPPESPLPARNISSSRCTWLSVIRIRSKRRPRSSLRNSNTSLDGRAKHWLFGWGITALALVGFAAAAYPIDPLRIFSRYMREYWGIEKGFPGGSVSAIAQTTDGYLWIGT